MVPRAIWIYEINQTRPLTGAGFFVSPILDIYVILRRYDEESTASGFGVWTRCRFFIPLHFIQNDIGKQKAG